MEYDHSNMLRHEESMECDIYNHDRSADSRRGGPYGSLPGGMLASLILQVPSSGRLVRAPSHTQRRVLGCGMGQTTVEGKLNDMEDKKESRE